MQILRNKFANPSIQEKETYLKTLSKPMSAIVNQRMNKN